MDITNNTVTRSITCDTLTTGITNATNARCTNGSPISGPPPAGPNASPTAHTGPTVSLCIACVTLAIGTPDNTTAHSIPGDALRTGSTSGDTSRHTTCNTPHQQRHHP